MMTLLPSTASHRAVSYTHLDVYKRQAVHGRGAASITRILVEEKVPTPGWLNLSLIHISILSHRLSPARKYGRGSLWQTV